MRASQLWPSKYVVAADLNNKQVTLTIKELKMEEMGAPGQKEKKPVLYFEKATKGLILNRTNGMVIAALYGDEIATWTGKKITVYATTVRAFGKQHDVIRVVEKIPQATGAPAPPAPAPEPEPQFADIEDYLDDEGDGVMQASFVSDEPTRNPFEDGIPYYKAALIGLSPSANDLVGFAVSHHRNSDGECTMADYKKIKEIILPLCAKTHTQPVEILSILCQTEIRENNRVGVSLASALLRYLSTHLEDGKPNPEYQSKMAASIKEIAKNEVAHSNKETA